MRALRVLLPLVILAASETGALAGIRPSFRLDACTWEATHIVLVTEGAKIDGVVEVLESWKGDLNRGDQIRVPELAAFASEKKRIIPKRPYLQEANLPASITCSRMVLFLIRKQEKADGGGPGKTIWLPADDVSKTIDVSAAWIEGDKVFAFVQKLNPGPSELTLCEINECALKCRVDDILAAQIALKAAIRRDNATTLALAIPPLLGSDSWYVRYAVIQALGKAGSNGVPALRNIIKDESSLTYHAFAIRALAEAGGVSVGPELTELLKQEMVFWMKVGPGLKDGWWNGAGLDWGEVERLREHYGRVYETLKALTSIRFGDCRQTVSAFRDFWRSHPQLRSDHDQLGQECDLLLASLR